jgi:hypothetical protein
MFDRLDRITDRAAYMAVAVGTGVSLLAAVLVPQDVQLGAWVRLVIWHGMLSAACILGILAMGVLAITYLVARRERAGAWARALQVALLPLWGLAVLVGAGSARLVWNSWNLTERRMTMSIAYLAIAAIALMIALVWENRRAGAVGQVVTSLAMAAGLVWILMGPAGEDVHPASAVLSSPDVAFKVYALVMMGGSLLAILAISVPIHRWLAWADTGQKPD